MAMRDLLRKLPHASWFFAAGLLSAGSIAIRVLGTGRVTFVFLAWNLFLAGLPYLLAAGLVARWSTRRRIEPIGVVIFIAWLALLPNAPYVLTDFMHLQRSDPRLWWYDVMLLATCAGTAWALGLVSLAMVHGVLRQAIGQLRARLVVVLVCVLAAIGVYLGRFLRFNSWDVVVAPGALVEGIAAHFWAPTEHRRTYAFVAFFSALLVLSYGALRTRLTPAPTR